MYLTVAHLFLDAAAVVELKTSVSSRVAYLDYHCFFSPVGWRFPSLWRQPGSQSRHVTLKPLYGFHCTKGHPSFLTCIVWLDFEKKTRHYSGFLIPNSTVHQIMTEWKSNLEFWLKLLTIHPVVCFHNLMYDMMKHNVLCWKVPISIMFHVLKLYTVIKKCFLKKVNES